MSHMPLDQPDNAELPSEEDAEDRMSLEDSRKRGEFVPWEQVKADLGLAGGRKSGSV